MLLSYISIIIFLSSLSQTDLELKKLSWMQLDDMTMEYKYNEEFGFDIPYPIFGEDIKKLNGQEVSLEGYVLLISADDDEEIVILSKYPYSQCFFCGGAGPESVVDVLLTSEYLNHNLKMDQKVLFKGRLKLNADDLDHLNYIFEDAEIISAK